jgi:predicted lipid-binding transport protein (Tim44 family)
VVLSRDPLQEVTMNKLLLSTIALVTVFSMPASAAPGYPHPFRDMAKASSDTEANSQQRQATEQPSQSREVADQVDVPEMP